MVLCLLLPLLLLLLLLLFFFFFHTLRSVTVSSAAFPLTVQFTLHLTIRYFQKSDSELKLYPHAFLVSTLHGNVWAASRSQLSVLTFVNSRDVLNSVDKSEIFAVVGNRTQFSSNPFRSQVTVLSRLVRVPHSLSGRLSLGSREGQHVCWA